jgi:hypothetical protein
LFVWIKVIKTKQMREITYQREKTPAVSNLTDWERRGESPLVFLWCNYQERKESCRDWRRTKRVLREFSSIRSLNFGSMGSFYRWFNGQDCSTMISSKGWKSIWRASLMIHRTIITFHNIILFYLQSNLI